LKVSIITVVRNRESSIRNAIKSVLSQNYPNIEYIVIDGDSSDNTFEIVKDYRKEIAYCISEPDDGIYYAMNKGMKFANGNVIGILNSDDIFYNENTITSVVQAIKKHNVDSCHGDEIIINHNDKVIRYCKSMNDVNELFDSGRHPHHGTFFVKKEVYEKYGYFDTLFKRAADYDLMLRFLIKNKISTYYLQEPLVVMRSGGESQKNLINRIKANYECFLAYRKYGLKKGIFFIFKKPLSKLQEYFRAFKMNRNI